MLPRSLAGLISIESSDQWSVSGDWWSVEQWACGRVVSPRVVHSSSLAPRRTDTSTQCRDYLHKALACIIHNSATMKNAFIGVGGCLNEMSRRAGEATCLSLLCPLKKDCAEIATNHLLDVFLNYSVRGSMFVFNVFDV